jgi:hypothetical protein
MKLVTVYRSFNEAEAQLAKSRLEAAEFEVYIAHELAATAAEGFSIATGGVLVQVPDERADEAKALLESENLSAPPPPPLPVS